MARLGFIGLILAGWVAATTATADNNIDRYQAGSDYQVIDQPVDQPASGSVRVKEFFLYSCSHCYAFEPSLEKWLDTLGDDVAFERSPVLFGRGSKAYARIYYSEQMLDVEGQLHNAVFDAIHKDHRGLQERSAIQAFFKAHGVSKSRFGEAYDSQSVDKSVAAARRRMRRFGVRAVPSLAVAGRYWISARTAGSNERMLEVATYLIDKTRRARQSNGSK